MRRILITIGVLLLASCSSDGEVEVPVTTGVSTTAATLPPSPATTGSVPAETTSTIPAPAATTTTTSVPAVDEAVCAFYADYLRADTASAGAESLRLLSVALGFPRDAAVSSALDVLRGRSAERSESAAKALLDDAFGADCSSTAGAESARLDGVFEAGVLVGGPSGVALLDGTPIIEPDPTGTYLAAFDSRRGGVLALLEVGGLEIIDHRSDTTAISRDLVLAEDARLHDTARIGGSDVGIVTIWEPEGEFGELAQNLYLAPVDGGALILIATVGDLLAAAETISYATDTFLITESELGGPARIYALDSSGELIGSLPGLPIVAPPEGDGSVAALQFARLAPDGKSYAFLRTRPSLGAGATGDMRTDVVLQRLADGVEVVSIEIGVPADQHTSLDFDGRFVIVTARDRLLVVDTRADEGPELSTIPVPDAEFAYFLDTGLATSGDR